MTTPIHLLILEDNALDAELIIDELSKAGFEPEWRRVETETDYLAALEAGQSSAFPYDLILSDWNLPNFDGLRALQSLKKRDMDIPFIIVSGKIGEETAINAMLEGVDDYVMKNRPARLGQAVMRALEQKKLREEKRINDESLRESEKRYRQLLAVMPIGIAVLQDNKIVFTNPAGARILGAKSPEELIGKPIKEIVHPDNWESTRSRIQRMLAGETGLYPVEDRYIRLDGPVVQVEIIAAPLTFHGKPAIQKVFADITERSKALDTLRESEERFRMLAEISAAGIFRTDALGNTTYLNRRLIEISGLDARIGIGVGWFHSIDPTDWKNLAGEWQKSVRERQIFKAEFRYKRADGSVVWVIGQANPVFNSTREFIGHIGYLLDFTDRRQAEEAIRASEDRYRDLVDHIHDMVGTHDLQGRILSINPAAINLLGISQDDLLKMNLRDLLVPETRDKFDEYLSAIQKDKHAKGLMRIQTCRGERRTWEYDCTLRTDTANGPIVRAMARDITERKQAEDRIKQQLDRLTALRAIDQAISSSFDLQVTLEIILDWVISQLGADATMVLLLNPHRNTLEFRAGRGFRGTGISHLHLSLGDDYSWQAALERHPVDIPDLNETSHPFIQAHRIENERFIAYQAVPLIAKGQVKGVLEVFHRAPFKADQEWLDFLENLAGQAAIAIDNSELFEGLQRSNFELSLAYNTTIEGWSHALDLRDKETEGHTQRVTELTLGLARSLGFSDEQLVHIRRGALLHDIGKMGVPDNILFKPDPLTEEEWEIMRKHPVFAYELLSRIPYLKPALEIPFCHHEKWDGTGYPRGLKGEEIPLAARLFAVPDVYDALTSDRPYRKSRTKEEAIEYLRQQAGMHFDPKAVELFLQLVGKEE